jgi:glutamine amidotransferase
MLTIIDFGDPSVTEVESSLKKITDDFIVSNNEFDICRSDKVILPGSGSAAVALKKIHLLNLFSVLRIIKKPMLGIGLGMQIMADYSTEGNVSCLGIFPGTAIKFNEENPESSHKGFHNINIFGESSLFNGIKNNTQFYFNNSYYLPQNEFTTSVCKNDITFCSSVENDMCFGVQFHPEKSGDAGLILLKNFVEM